MDRINAIAIAHEISQNKYRLLGQISVTESQYTELLNALRMRVENITAARAEYPDLVLSLGLVQIAIRCYKEGRFWPCFNEELGMDIPASRQTMLGRAFLATLKKYDLFYIDSLDGASQYVENIKAHAYVTNYYLPGFFDFSFAYYENNLFRDLSSDISEDLEELSYFMKDSLLHGEENTLSSETAAKTAKTYKLLKSTKSVFAGMDSYTLFGLFYPVLKMADSYFYDDIIPARSEDRISNGFAEWCRTQREKYQNDSRQRTGITRKLYTRKPYVRLSNQKDRAWLVIPPQKFRHEDFNESAEVCIAINGEETTVNLEIYRSFGIYITEELLIPINDIYAEMEITILSASEKVYRIPASRFRIFNLSLNSGSKFLSGQNLLFTRPDLDVQLSSPDTLLDQYANAAFGMVYVISFDEDTICYLEGKPYTLAGLFSFDPIFEREIDGLFVYTEDGNEMKATKSHPNISFLVSKEKLAGTVIEINQKKYSIETIEPKTVFEWPKDRSLFGVNLSLDDYLPPEKGRYDVCIDIPGEPVRTIAQYLLMIGFAAYMNKRRYIFQDEGILTIRHNGYAVNTEYDKIEDEEISYKLSKFRVPFSNDTSGAVFQFSLNDTVYTAEVPIQRFCIGFSEDEMSYEKPDVWYTDVKETLYISLPGATHAGAYLNDDKSIVCEGTQIKDNLFRIDISAFTHQIKENERVKWFYINILYTDNKQRRISGVRVQRLLQIDPYFQPVSVNGKFAFDIQITGDAALYIRVKEHRTQTVVCERFLLHNGYNIMDIPLNGIYDIYPHMEETDEFGFDTEITELKPLANVCYIDINDLVRCGIRIHHIEHTEQKIHFAYDYFIDVKEQVGPDLYVGYMFGLELEKIDQPFKYKKDQSNKKIKVKLGKVRMQIKDRSEAIRFYLDSYSKQEEDWMSFVYNKASYSLLCADDPVLDSSGNYRRFVFLDEEETVFVAKTKDIRRMDYDIPSV